MSLVVLICFTKHNLKIVSKSSLLINNLDWTEVQHIRKPEEQWKQCKTVSGFVETKNEKLRLQFGPISKCARALQFQLEKFVFLSESQQLKKVSGFR